MATTEISSRSKRINVIIQSCEINKISISRPRFEFSSSRSDSIRFITETIKSYSFQLYNDRCYCKTALCQKRKFAIAARFATIRSRIRIFTRGQ